LTTNEVEKKVVVLVLESLADLVKKSALLLQFVTVPVEGFKARVMMVESGGLGCNGPSRHTTCGIVS
jgi:hypothetical protein